MSDSDAPTRPENDVQMGFFEHLTELRVRLLRALYGVVPGIGVAWFFKEELLDFLLAPLILAWHKLGLGEPEIHFANPIDPFVAYLKIAIIIGVILATPWIFWQVWGFIAPGLYKKERYLAIPFVLASTICFAGGSFFGYAIVFPMGFEMFLGFAGDLPSQAITMRPTIMINEYLSFSTRLLLAFGVVFEVPVVITFLAAAGIVDHIQLIKFARWWVLVATLLSAFLTPPDVASQLMMLIPLIILYFIGVGIAFLFTLKRRKKAKAEAD